LLPGYGDGTPTRLMCVQQVRSTGHRRMKTEMRSVQMYVWDKKADPFPPSAARWGGQYEYHSACTPLPRNAFLIPRAERRLASTNLLAAKLLRSTRLKNCFAANLLCPGRQWMLIYERTAGLNVDVIQCECASFLQITVNESLSAQQNTKLDSMNSLVQPYQVQRTLPRTTYFYSY